MCHEALGDNRRLRLSLDQSVGVDGRELPQDPPIAFPASGKAQANLRPLHARMQHDTGGSA